MKTSTIDIPVDRTQLNGHHALDRFSTRPRQALRYSRNRGDLTFGKMVVSSRQVGCEDDNVDSLWINTIGDRIVGMARLVQNGPHSARIVFFRIDPEWCHTKVPLNLIHSIQDFCQNHGWLNVNMQPGIVPPWMSALLHHRDFHFFRREKK